MTQEIYCNTIKPKPDGLPAGRKQMALGFSPLNTKVEGGEIMSDFEIISVVIMIASLVLKAIKFGRDTKNKKKK